MSTKEMEKKEGFFSARRVAFMAAFTALAFVVSLLEFPLFPATPASFLKLDFGNVFVMLIGFLLGPVEGVIVCVLKEVIRIPFGTTGGVGELANMLVTTAYLLLPATVYRFRKGIKTAIVCLVVATLATSVIALAVNRFINFPLYMGDSAEQAFASLWGYIFIFNLIKWVSISVVVCLLYKTLSRIYGKFE